MKLNKPTVIINGKRTKIDCCPRKKQKERMQISSNAREKLHSSWFEKPGESAHC